jgi:stage V sporulation protein K
MLCCAPCHSNPGTGKTTVARLVAAALFEMDVVQCDKFVELGGASVLADGIAEFKKVFEEELEDGGVLFIDEVYQLNPKTDKSGAQIVNYLLKAVEDMRDKVVVIVAGYSDQARARAKSSHVALR